MIFKGVHLSWQLTRLTKAGNEPKCPMSNEKSPVLFGFEKLVSNINKSVTTIVFQHSC